MLLNHMTNGMIYSAYVVSSCEWCLRLTQQMRSESEIEAASPTRTAGAAPAAGEDGPATEAQAEGSGSPTRPRPATPKSEDSGSVKSVSSTMPMDESTAYSVKARTEM